MILIGVETPKIMKTNVLSCFILCVLFSDWIQRFFGNLEMEMKNEKRGKK